MGFGEDLTIEVMSLRTQLITAGKLILLDIVLLFF